MRPFALLLLVTLAVPATVVAQFPGGMGGGMGRRGGRGGMGRGGEGEGNERGAPPALPSNADVEAQDPIVLLLSKRHDLTLSDSQFTQLTRLDATLMEQNRPLMARLDSARTASPSLVASDSAPPPDQRGEVGRGGAAAGDRRAFMDALRQIRRNDEATASQALALLNGDQRARAEKLLDDQRKKLDDAMGRRGSGPGARRGPPRDGAPE